VHSRGNKISGGGRSNYGKLRRGKLILAE